MALTLCKEMGMAKYEVVRPWFGVKVGDIGGYKRTASSPEVERSCVERRVVTAGNQKRNQADPM